MDVSVIIINYNTCGLTLQCLHSLYEKTVGLLFEVIVVDNASSDNSVECIMQTYPQVKLVKSSDNIGFGKGNNLGYKYSSGQYVFLLNPDTILVNNAVEILWSFLKDHMEFSIVGGQLLDKDLFPMHSYSFLFPSLRWEFNILLRGYIAHRIECKKRMVLSDTAFFPVAYVTGADMMIRRSVIEELGLFDSDFFMYFEETELSYRYLQHGYISCFFSMAQIIHLEGRSFDFKEKREKMYFEGRKLFYEKKYIKYYRILSDIVYLIVCFTRMFYFIVFFKKEKLQEWCKRLSIYYTSIMRKCNSSL